MIRVTISYPRVAGAAFDHDYYINSHLPLIVDRVGAAAASVTVDRGLTSPPWPEAENEVVCTFVCESREAFEGAFFAHLEELQDDMERCGGTAPTIHIGDIIVDRFFAADMIVATSLPRTGSSSCGETPHAEAMAPC